MKTAILGLGTVGGGTYEALSGTDVTVCRILDRRKIKGFEKLLTENYDEIINDKGISIVAETMGGLHPAREFALRAMNAGKHFVTSNKLLVSHCFDELCEAAEKNGVCFRYTASVGGGIPWLFNLQRQCRLDTVTSVYGIVNGTTDFILDSMERYGAEFSESLAQAQRMGYAEADPSSDIDGLDSARKIAISGSVAFGETVDERDVAVFGIRNLRAKDVVYYTGMGLKCRLIATSFINNGKVRAYVEPILITSDMLEYGVRENFNLITMECKNAGRLSFYGQGAGKYPTGYAVANDILDIAGKLCETGKYKPVRASVDNSLEAHKYYIRSEYIPPYVPKEVCDGGMCITSRISVAEMHRISDEILQKDGEAFFAAIGECK